MSVESELSNYEKEQDRNEATAKAYEEQAVDELVTELIEDGHIFLTTEDDSIPILKASIPPAILRSNVVSWLESEGADLVAERIHDIDQRERERMQEP